MCLCQGTETQRLPLTLLLTQTFLIQGVAPLVLLCNPNSCLCWVVFLYLSAFFFPLTSSTSNDHHSLGHPNLSWTGALAALHLLVSQLMGSWQPFSLYKDRVQAALWCCQTMTSTGLPADFFALSPLEQKATGKHLVLYQAPCQYGFRLCYCMEQTACPVLDWYEGCFHLVRMLCILVGQVVPPIEPIQASSGVVSHPEIQRNNKNLSQTQRSKCGQNLCFMDWET